MEGKEKKAVRPHRILEPGERYGRWTVKEYLGSIPTYAGSLCRARMYRCVCDCGKEGKVRGSDLTRGKTRSCGCLRGRRERTAEAVETAVTHIPPPRAPRPYVPENPDQFTDDWMFGGCGKVFKTCRRKRR